MAESQNALWLIMSDRTSHVKIIYWEGWGGGLVGKVPAAQA